MTEYRGFLPPKHEPVMSAPETDVTSGTEDAHNLIVPIVIASVVAAAGLLVAARMVRSR